jgi:TolB-like protein/DNA-binding winged helix-turn-helix (wHTH) protein
VAWPVHPCLYSLRAAAASVRAQLRGYTSPAGNTLVVDTAFEFGEFRLDCGRFELYRAGSSVKLERKPLELLILLVQREGQLVTREEIAHHLWGSEVFVDTEHGINTAIRKIRHALRDDPEQPRFVETVTGKGYRFAATAAEAPQSQAPGPTPATAADAELPSRQPASHPRSRLWLVILGALTALAFLIAAVNLGARGWRNRLRGGAARPEISSLAVLPLDNLSGDPSQDYFADGMTDELTTMLAKNSTLRVVSRTSVMQYKRVHRPLPEIARELGVDGILEGSVARSGNHVHMTIQLIQAPTDSHLWAESYDRDANDAVALPLEAAQTIAGQLNRAVLHPSTPRFVRPEAHDAYLHGRYLWFTDHNDRAGEYFKKATELQPDYSLGWSGLSAYYGAGAVDGELDPQQSLPAEESAARKAVALDDSQPWAHLVMSAAFFFDRWDFPGAEQEMSRSIALDPRFAEAYHLHAKMLGVLNRHREAIEAEKKATELDPFSRPYAMALVMVEARQYDQAISEARQRLESNPDEVSLHWLIYYSLRGKGLEKEAGQELEQTLLQDQGKSSPAIVRAAFQQGGLQGLVKWQLNEAQKWSSAHYVPPYYLAELHAQLGHREQALALLQQAYRERSPQLLWVQNNQPFDVLHPDERYRAIIKGIGLPPAY